MIHALSNQQIFHLEGDSSSYVVALFQGRLPGLYHWGSPIRPGVAALSRLIVEPQAYSVANSLAAPGGGRLEGVPPFHLTRLAQEYPGGLAGDYRSPAWLATDAQGRPAMDLLLRSSRVYNGRPTIIGLPFARSGQPGDRVQTLELILADDLTGLVVTLNYTFFPAYDTVVRGVSLGNEGKGPLDIRRAASFSIDLPPDCIEAGSSSNAARGSLCGAGPASGFELISFDGAWARERRLERRPLGSGRTVLASNRGVSSHHQSPAAILARPHTTEHQGEAYGFSLIYSGDWELSFERNDEGSWRIQGGINPETFSWNLQPGDSFQTPEAVLCQSGEGLNGLSDRLHRFVRGHILPPAWANRERPVLINNWEGTYFDFDTDRLLAIAAAAARTGVELFVLDDGWFGKRDSDTTGLGDWFVNERKLPGGLAGLAKGVHDLGLKFGLWFEPEMISPDSDLYRAHPDWCLHLEGRDRSPGRNQLVLDLTRAEVRAEIVARVKAILDSVPIDYVKWDMNRPLSHAGSSGLVGGKPLPQGEIRHRQMLGVYALMREITEAFPGILFEGCAGGGGRMDYGILHFMPQFWTSDDTDAIARLGIQYSTSHFFPPVTMASHVSATPNHQTGRDLPLAVRAGVAMGGNLGYELDATTFSPDELAEVNRDIEWYKAHRRLFQFGIFRRLRSPWESNEAAWIFISPDRTQAVVFWFRILSHANPPACRLRLAGLNPDANYQVLNRENPGEETVYSGSELLCRGLMFRQPLGDGAGLRFDLQQV